MKRLAKKYNSPEKVQKFLRKISYNHERNKETLRSAKLAIRKKTAHCFEATFIAAAILEHHGYPPLVLSFESQDKLDHVIYIFKQNSKWGSIGRSRDEGLHGRPPIYRSVLDLVWSYYEPYIDHTGKITAYQIAHLDDTKTDWRNSVRNVWKAEKYLIDLKHRKLASSPSRYKKIHANFLKYGHPDKKKHWW